MYTITYCWIIYFSIGMAASYGRVRVLQAQAKSDTPVKQSVNPSIQPVVKPAAQPSIQPLVKPAAQPSIQPVVKPAEQPSIQPPEKPTDTDDGQASKFSLHSFGNLGIANLQDFNTKKHLLGDFGKKGPDSTKDVASSEKDKKENDVKGSLIHIFLPITLTINKGNEESDKKYKATKD